MNKINLNQRIKVKLTNLGREHLKERYENYNSVLIAKQTPPKMDKEGFTEFPLWEFMFEFGNNMYVGAQNIIEDNNIYLTE